RHCNLTELAVFSVRNVRGAGHSHLTQLAVRPVRDVSRSRQLNAQRALQRLQDRHERRLRSRIVAQFGEHLRQCVLRGYNASQRFEETLDRLELVDGGLVGHGQSVGRADGLPVGAQQLGLLVSALRPLQGPPVCAVKHLRDDIAIDVPQNRRICHHPHLARKMISICILSVSPNTSMRFAPGASGNPCRMYSSFIASMTLTAVLNSATCPSYRNACLVPARRKISYSLVLSGSVSQSSSTMAAFVVPL